MDTIVARFSLVIVVAFLAACSAPKDTRDGGKATLDDAFERGRLVIEADDDVRHEFKVYLATNFEQRRRGLMFVRQLPADTGMLFIYEDDFRHSMWMKNTYIPLDMIFAHADGRVSSVIHDTQPLSMAPQEATEDVRYVLELNAGTARRLNIGRKSRLLLQDPD